jgi:dTMP kinase
MKNTSGERDTPIYSGKFIAMEGAEGVGKSSNILCIKEYLESKDITVVTTREPGGTRMGDSLRNVLLNQEKIDNKAELLLLFAARAQHITQVIIPALESGAWVISDRFIEASYAYQGGGRGIALDVIEYLDRWVLDTLKPDCTILLDAPPEVGMARARARGELDRIEREDMAFFHRIRQAYLDRAQQSGGRTVVIDATQSLSSVQIAIKKHIDKIAANIPSIQCERDFEGGDAFSA